MSRTVDGLLLLDKPSGPTSHDLIGAVRRALGQRRVGHAGTLDPLASGLLPIVLGCATRLVRFLPHSPKSYTGTFLVGLATTTDDVTGETVEQASGPLPEATAVEAAARQLEGSSMQTPPAFSARKVDGERAYRLARRGEAVSPAATPVEVGRFEVAPTDRPERFRFRTDVSKGTYVRALVRDLGRSLGCGATLESLRRTRIGPMAVEAAIAPGTDGRFDPAALRETVAPPHEMPLEAARRGLPDPESSQRFVQGLPIALPDPPEDGWVAVLDPEGGLLGMAEARQGRLHPRTVIRAKR